MNEPMTIDTVRDPNITRELATALYHSRWWVGLPVRDVALAQLRQPLLCMPFGEFHEVVEKAIGGPVWTHEFARPEAIISRIEGGGGRNPLVTLAEVLAPVVGAEGGERRDDSLPVASAEPGPDGVSDGPARASMEDA